MSKNTSNSLKFGPGFVVNNKYEIIEEVGVGYEGRVYAVREIGTNIERTIKFFYPDKNPKNRTVRAVAKKLHALRNSSILIQYHTSETLLLPNRQEVTYLISEFIDGVILSEFLKEFPGDRLQPFQALHLLYELVKGVEEVHRHNEYHADIHTDNILVLRSGLYFKLKLLDPFHWVGATKRDGQKDDIVNVVEVFFECLGGRKHYHQQPQAIKNICLGLKRPLILKKFRTISKLREYIETLEW